MRGEVVFMNEKYASVHKTEYDMKIININKLRLFQINKFVSSIRYDRMRYGGTVRCDEHLIFNFQFSYRSPL